MNRDAADDAALRRDMILASALRHTRPPTPDASANCYRVLYRALRAAGLWESALAEAFEGDVDRFPLVKRWYATLIAMTREPPPARPLLESAGDLETPAGPFYTACWLTPAGQIEAERVLARNPEWRRLLTDVSG